MSPRGEHATPRLHWRSLSGLLIGTCACNVSPAYAARKHGSLTDAAITWKGCPGANDLRERVARVEGGGGASCGARSGDLSSLRACEGA